MQRLLTAPRRILRLRRGTGKSSRVADESSVNGNREFDGYNHREGEAWHGAPVSVLVAVLRIPLIAVSCLCQAGGDELRVSTELPMSADEVNHLMVYDSRPYAIYV
ncbi:hypothetical protein IEQ34_005028 [Dendrobium chrysotoxum]|uniref:Uncharacterized protein n=1 Tax=Dendrobium chrysotoxum TaxID=161865 RepID=A0AAV7GSS2_DENCH|nr:hypothetical protein IEQ34_005028 [Dendrobium chrysotoxum]